MVKISFSGVAGSGKSAVIAEVKKILGLRFKVEEVDDITATNPFDADEAPCFAHCFYRMSTQINNENLKSSRLLDFLLCDRSIIDHWLYWQSCKKVQGKDSRLSRPEQVINNVFRFWLHTYDAFFLIRSGARKIETETKLLSGSETGVNDFHYSDLAYLNLFADEGIVCREIFNRDSVDESAHQVVQNLAQSGFIK